MLELSNEFWDCDVHTYHLDHLNAFAFSDETKILLLRDGLPRNHSIFNAKQISFFTAEAFKTIIFDAKECIIIGESLGALISIQSSTQQLFAVCPKSNSKILINSKLEYFLICHQLFYTELRQVENIDDDEVCEVFGKTMRRAFERIDPIAMLDPESTWSRVVEDYENCL